MTQPEYDQQKRECWEEYLSEHKTTYTQTAFDYAFDRAYSLGKQEKDADVPKKAESGSHSFSHILKDSFRDHNRLHIAAMAMQGILSNADRMKKYEYVATEPPCAELAVVVARKALRYADALISECKKGGVNA